MHASKGEKGIIFHPFPGQAGVQLPPGQQGSIMHNNDSEGKHRHSEISLLISLPPALCAEFDASQCPCGYQGSAIPAVSTLIPAVPACWCQGCWRIEMACASSAQQEQKHLSVISTVSSPNPKYCPIPAAGKEINCIAAHSGRETRLNISAVQGFVSVLWMSQCIK